MRKPHVDKYALWDALMMIGVVVAVVGIIGAIAMVVYTLGKDWF